MLVIQFFSGADFEKLWSLPFTLNDSLRLHIKEFKHKKTSNVTIINLEIVFCVVTSEYTDFLCQTQIVC